MHTRLKTFADTLRQDIAAGNPLEDQTVAVPEYWIEVTKGGAGYFAVMLWNGCGFPEPWETGVGRYGEPEPAQCEARAWAEAEGMEFRQ